MNYQDYYEILGVARDATSDVIRKAFRKLARKYHPDVSKEKDAETRMKEVNEAYAVLSNPEKRRAFDQLGRGGMSGEDFRAPPGWGSGFERAEHDYSSQGAADYSDFFSQLFGNVGTGREGRPHATERENRHAQIHLDIEDSFHGAQRGITLQSSELDNQGQPSLKSRTLNVKIPKGVHAGQTIRLAGQGTPNHLGAPAGDLLLEVRFNPHPRLRPEGRDLHLTLPVAPWEAALGATLPITLPGSEIKVRVPQGSQTGQQLRLRGKGLPSEPPGDLLLDLKVVLPRADTEAARAAYEEFARAMPFDPRKED